MTTPNRRARGPYLSGLAAAIALALPGAVAAEELAQREPDEKASAEAPALETVTVTAQRRLENIQDVPMAITAVESEKLEVLGSGGDDIRFLSGRLPSLNIESSFGRAFPRFYIRGLGNTDFDLNASQPVSLVYDGVVQENPILKGFPIFDLDQVEMARGPQGTLFGRNSPAGVIKFESARPQQEFGGYARLSYGSYGTTNLSGAVTGALGASTSARLSVLNQRREDWVDNTRNGPGDDLEGYRESAARLQLLHQPSDAFEALLNLHARKLDGTARLFRANIIQQGTNDLVPGFQRDRVSIDGRNEQDLSQFGANLRLRWDLGGTTLHSITGYESVDAYSRGDIDGGYGAVFLGEGNYGPGLIPFPAESADGLPNHRQLTQEFRLESNEWGRFDWQAGVFGFDESIDVDTFSYDTLAPGQPQNGYATQKQDNQAWAVFASGDYDLTERLKLRGGVRYSDDRKEFTAARVVGPFGPPIAPIRISPTDTDVSWDLSAVYQANETVNLYGRVARGFRAPSVQGRLMFADATLPSDELVTVAESETVLSWEGGIKAQLWQNRLRLGFSLYHYTIDDPQLTAVGGNANIARLVNADKAVGRGAELDLEALLSERLLVTVGASFNDTEIQDDSLAVFQCAAPCTVLDPAGSVAGTARIDGNPLPQAPRHVYNLTARYGIPMAGGEFFIYTDWAYRSKVNFFLYESVEFTGKALLEGGLRLGYNWNYGDYELALFGRNITDREVIVGGLDFNNLNGFLNEPRTWGVEFKATF
ncbi:iron complex outermembrane receptor protein [Tahibacter aquaticus]|uniref:Iron complex outermembrane receptor protein n=1 Tax=Tahibacter aquaticus TaxID=520092 RepID=A0A4R6YQH3_9GAMM|nr:TonB-dependent receptor [Tahibacter aquaticus]TDR40007.1 iron complex outermembrane receptor protein [Tahibacter aquaticus]